MRWFANHQPMTPIVNMARGLLDAQAMLSSHTIIVALVWLIAACVIFGVLAYRVYQRLFLAR